MVLTLIIGSFELIDPRVNFLISKLLEIVVKEKFTS